MTILSCKRCALAVTFDVNIDKIVFTSPNMPSPTAVGTRSHIIPDEMDLGTWYESGTEMYRAAVQQNIYDNSYSQGLDRPIFGFSGIVASGTTFIEDSSNYIYIQTDQVWPTNVPFNLYIDDNSWFVVDGVSEYNYADPPPPAPKFNPTSFTTSGTITTTRNVTVNGSVCAYNNLTYIFNTKELYTFDITTQKYTHISTCPYTVTYPVTMVGYDNKLYIFSYENTTLKTLSYDLQTLTWSELVQHTCHKTAAEITALGSYLINNIIYVSLKYSENTVPAEIYLYLYDPSNNSWTEEFVDLCGKYNLNINDSMIESDGTYLYLLERFSKLLHKINLTTKDDTQVIVINETDSNSSMILYNNVLYIYNSRTNTFESYDPSTDTSVSLTAPTIEEVDKETVENTTLSDDGSYIYLTINKGVNWVNKTFIYKYDVSSDTWSASQAPQAGSISFNGRLCTDGTNIYGVDTEYLFKYNITDKSWDKLAPLPRDDAEDPTICANSTHVYVLISQCGYFWRYDLTTSTWEVLQTVSLPAPTAYEGTAPGIMVIDGDNIYLGLYYNYVTATRDTFYYTYNITNNTWSAAVAPKTETNRSFFMYPYIDNGDLMLAGCVVYNGSDYTYTIYRRTDATNNTWSTDKQININALATGRYLCMYGQTLVGTKLYINFTTTDNLGFNCSGSECRQLDLGSQTSDYWMPNPSNTMYTVAVDTSYVYYVDTTTNVFHKYDIAAATTTTEALPRQSYVNYFICNYNNETYLLGKQELEHNPALYSYKFIVYKDNNGSWDIYDTYVETDTNLDNLKLNPIQEYYMLAGTVYMASFIKTANTNLLASHKKYVLSSKEFTTMPFNQLTTSITSKDANTLCLAVGNEVDLYDLTLDTSSLFISGITGNRSSAFLYVYLHTNGNIRAIGGQQYTTENGGKYITYENNNGWVRIKETNISSTFYNTLAYTDLDPNTIYIVNTTSHLKYFRDTDSISYVADAPTNTSLCCPSTASGIELFSDHYNCYAYHYITNFAKLAGDISRTYACSNLATISGVLYFTKNSVTNELSLVDTVTNTPTTITTDIIFGTTPYILNVNNELYFILPDYNALYRLSGNSLHQLISNIILSDYPAACYDGASTIYCTGGQYSYTFYKLDIQSNTAQQVANLPEQQSMYASLYYINNTLYYITNYTLYTYNPTTDAWAKVTTLNEPINARGIVSDGTYLYYCGPSSINSIGLDNPTLQYQWYNPIPVMHHGAITKIGTSFILQYNELEVRYTCSIYHSDDVITELDLNSANHTLPTAIPYNLTVLDTTEKAVKIRWEIASQANITHYRVYRRDFNSSEFKYIGQTTTVQYIDTLADRGKQYYYKVRACNDWGSTSTLSNEVYVKVDGVEYKYAFSTSTWEHRKKDYSELELSKAFRWGNSNIDFNDSVVIKPTLGEAYDCYITAWDDDTHSTTNNVLLQHNCYRISACAFCSSSSTQLEEPDSKAMYAYPRYNVILKGNDSFYGLFNINYEPLQNREGAFILFKPILINIPTDIMVKGKYEFVTTFHYKYT